MSQVSRNTWDNVVLVTRDGATDQTWDGKIKNLVYDVDSMSWIAQTSVAASTPGGSTADNQAVEIDLLTSLDNKAPALASGRVPVDGSGVTQPVSAAALPLPSGASTAARQDTTNTTLSSIDGKITAVNTGAVVVSSSALPSGAATSALQSTGNTTLSSIDGKTPALISGRVPVDGSGVTQPVSGEVSIGTSAGKTNILRTGALVTTLSGVDQVALTYTVTTGQTFYLEYFDVAARLTLYSTTATNFGTASLESPALIKLYTQIIANAGVVTPVRMTFSEPIPIPSGTVIRIVVTPSALTSFTWMANLGGYEK